MLIFTAIRGEAKAVAEAFGVRLDRKLGPVSCPGCVVPVELHVIGMRATHLPPALKPANVCGIIMAGLAGTLDPSLRIGDVIVDGLPADSTSNASFRRGPIHTADCLVATPAEKAALFHATGALAVEMEGRMVRALAHEIGVPFLAIRAISDTANESLDPAILNLVDERGRARPVAIAAALLRRPRMAIHLKRLAANSDLAARNMAAVLHQLLVSPATPAADSPGPLLRWLAG